MPNGLWAVIGGTTVALGLFQTQAPALSSLPIGLLAFASAWAAAVLLLIRGEGLLGPDSQTSARVLASGFLLAGLAGPAALYAGPSLGESTTGLLVGGLRTAGTLLAFAGTIQLFLSSHSGLRAQIWHDAWVASLSLLLPTWFFIINGLWQKPGAWTLDRALISLAPFGGIALLFAAVSLVMAGGQSRNRPHAALGLGMIGWALLGSLAAFLGSKTPGMAGFDGAGWGEIATLWAGLWILPFLIRPGRGGRLGQEPAAAHSVSLLPHALAGASFLFTALFEAYSTGSVSISVVVFGFILVAGAANGQIRAARLNQVALEDNALLTAKLRQVSESLEATVERRTEQLNALHSLTRAISTSLDPDEVLSLTALHTRTALQADAVVLWGVDPEKPGAPLKGVLQIGLGSHPKLAAALYSTHPTQAVESTPIPLDPSDPATKMAALLRAPLMARKKLVGMVGALRFQGAFSKVDWEMLESIGLEAANAIEHARQYSAAVEAADRDAVTGMLNHRAIHQRCDDILEEARSTGSVACVMMMDMNNFKMFNDTYGHPAGDEALRRVARALTEECEGRGAVGRYGGDEFLAVFSGMDATEVSELATRVRTRLLKTGFMPNPQDGRVIPLSLSFGISVFPEEGQNRHDLIALADSNLYAAKRTDGGIGVTTDSQRANRELRGESSFAVLDGMVTAVDNKDSYTRRHSEDVAEFSLWIAEELGMSAEAMRTLRIGALLHDVGKICVPDDILRKPGRLTPEEFEILKRHPHLGALIVGGVAGMEGIIDIVRHHHERFDGNGYPDELRGDEIPLMGRLVAVADTMSAMTTDRPYRKGRDWASALTEIHAMRGSQFDPVMAEAFLRAVQKRYRAGTLPAHAMQELHQATAARAA
ncbi:MAG: diguanylate cyclase [Fimbriimonadaceae bacterium]|nr:diguanylate cyclase [Fimbriimonadaceae bacterium]